MFFKKKPFYLLRPVHSKFGVSLGFRAYPQWLQKLIGRINHKGIDFACPTGTKILAAIAGIVFLVKYHPEYGNLVVVRTFLASLQDYIYTYYAHLDIVSIVGGQGVKTYTEIGRSGDTGIVSGAHLHFELRVGGFLSTRAVDPRPYMKYRMNET